MILLKTEHQRCLKAPVEWVQFIRTFNRKKPQPLCSSNQHKHSCRWALPLEGNLGDSVCAQQCEDTGMRLLAGQTSVLYHKHCREHRLPRSTEPLHSLQAAPAQKTGHTPLDVMTRVRKCCSRGVSSQSRFRYTPVQEEKGQAAVSLCQAPQAPSSLSGSQALEAPDTHSWKTS